MELNPTSPPSVAFSLGAAKIQNVINKKERERERKESNDFFSFAHDTKCSDFIIFFFNLTSDHEKQR